MIADKRTYIQAFFISSVVMFTGAICAGIIYRRVLLTSIVALAFLAAAILGTVARTCASLGSVLVCFVWSCVAATYTFIDIDTPEIINQTNRLLLFCYFELGLFLHWVFLRKRLAFTTGQLLSQAMLAIAPIISTFIVRAVSGTVWSYVAVPAALAALYWSFMQVELKGGVDK